MTFFFCHWWQYEQNMGNMATVLTFKLSWEMSDLLSLLSSARVGYMWSKMVDKFSHRNVLITTHLRETEHIEEQQWSEASTYTHAFRNTHRSSGRTMYPRGACCHISHFAEPCESHFVWSCYGYLSDPAGPRGKWWVLNVYVNMDTVWNIWQLTVSSDCQQEAL